MALASGRLFCFKLSHRSFPLGVFTTGRPATEQRKILAPRLSTQDHLCFTRSHQEMIYNPLNGAQCLRQAKKGVDVIEPIFARRSEENETKKKGKKHFSNISQHLSIKSNIAKIFDLWPEPSEPANHRKRRAYGATNHHITLSRANDELPPLTMAARWLASWLATR